VEVESVMKFKRQPGGRVRSRMQGTRGFTLIEIMVVIVIITLLAAIALPSISSRLRNERAHAVTEAVATLFRGARLHALGRGAATAVRYDTGRMLVLEAISGPGCNTAAVPGCNTIPISSCTDIVGRFAAGSLIAQQVGELPDTTEGGTLTSAFLLAGVNAGNAVDICFSPMGRAFIRAGASSAALDSVPFQPMTTSGRIRVQVVGGAGGARSAVLAPNGAARAVHE
jgi:prepilin-type N-terminal cleavage/methylation domain-containing protein